MVIVLIFAVGIVLVLALSAIAAAILASRVDQEAEGRPEEEMPTRGSAANARDAQYAATCQNASYASCCSPSATPSTRQSA